MGWDPGLNVKVPESHHRVSPYCQRLNFGKPIEARCLFTRLKRDRCGPSTKCGNSSKNHIAMGPIHVHAKYWHLGRGILRPHYTKPGENVGEKLTELKFFTNLSGSTKPFESRRISQKALGGCFQVAAGLVGETPGPAHFDLGNASKPNRLWI